MTKYHIDLHKMKGMNVRNYSAKQTDLCKIINLKHTDNGFEMRNGGKKRSADSATNYGYKIIGEDSDYAINQIGHIVYWNSTTGMFEISSQTYNNLSASGRKRETLYQNVFLDSASNIINSTVRNYDKLAAVKTLTPNIFILFDNSTDNSSQGSAIFSYNTSLKSIMDAGFSNRDEATQITGTGTVSASTTSLTGVSTAFLTELSIGCTIWFGAGYTDHAKILAIASNTAATLDRNITASTVAFKYSLPLVDQFVLKNPSRLYCDTNNGTPYQRLFVADQLGIKRIDDFYDSNYMNNWQIKHKWDDGSQTIDGITGECVVEEYGTSAIWYNIGSTLYRKSATNTVSKAIAYTPVRIETHGNTAYVLDSAGTIHYHFYRLSLGVYIIDEMSSESTGLKDIQYFGGSTYCLIGTDGRYIKSVVYNGTTWTITTLYDCNTNGITTATKFAISLNRGTDRNFLPVAVMYNDTDMWIYQFDFIYSSNTFQTFELQEHKVYTDFPLVDGYIKSIAVGNIGATVLCNHHSRITARPFFNLAVTNYLEVQSTTAGTGTATVSAGKTSVTGTSTKFLDELSVGDIIWLYNGAGYVESAIVKTITSDTALTTESPVIGAYSTKAFKYSNSLDLYGIPLVANYQIPIDPNTPYKFNVSASPTKRWRQWLITVLPTPTIDTSVSGIYMLKGYYDTTGVYQVIGYGTEETDKASNTGEISYIAKQFGNTFVADNVVLFDTKQGGSSWSIRASKNEERMAEKFKLWRGANCVYTHVNTTGLKLPTKSGFNYGNYLIPAGDCTMTDSNTIDSATVDNHDFIFNALNEDGLWCLVYHKGLSSGAGDFGIITGTAPSLEGGITAIQQSILKSKSNAYMPILIQGQKYILRARMMNTSLTIDQVVTFYLYEDGYTDHNGLTLSQTETIPASPSWVGLAGGNWTDITIEFTAAYTGYMHLRIDMDGTTAVTGNDIWIQSLDISTPDYFQAALAYTMYSADKFEMYDYGYGNYFNLLVDYKNKAAYMTIGGIIYHDKGSAATYVDYPLECVSNNTGWWVVTENSLWLISGTTPAAVTVSRVHQGENVLQTAFDNLLAAHKNYCVLCNARGIYLFSGSSMIDIGTEIDPYITVYPGVAFDESTGEIWVRIAINALDGGNYPTDGTYSLVFGFGIYNPVLQSWRIYGYSYAEQFTGTGTVSIWSGAPSTLYGTLGSGTIFLTELSVGDIVWFGPGYTNSAKILSVASDETAYLDKNVPATGGDVAFKYSYDGLATMFTGVVQYSKKISGVMFSVFDQRQHLYRWIQGELNDNEFAGYVNESWDKPIVQLTTREVHLGDYTDMKVLYRLDMQNDSVRDLLSRYGINYLRIRLIQVYNPLKTNQNILDDIEQTNFDDLYPDKLSFSANLRSNAYSLTVDIMLSRNVDEYNMKLILHDLIVEYNDIMVKRKGGY